MSGVQFNFFGDDLKDANLQQVMQKIQQQDSFEFDKFDNVPSNHANQRSFNSDFLQPKQSQKMKSAKAKQDSYDFQFENSRNISEISIAQNSKNRSFKFENPPQSRSNPLRESERYDKLQKMLNKAKTNNLELFYRNLDQQNIYVNEQKFRNKQQFKRYRNQLKIYKRGQQNHFLELNGNYKFKKDNYKKDQPNNNPFDSGIERMFGKKAVENYNFKKKDTSSDADPFKIYNNPQSNNLLPMNFGQDDQQFDQFQLKPDQINREVQKYQQKQYLQQAEQFFAPDSRKQKSEKPIKKLETINEERANMFQVTQQQQKMNKLLTNYQQLKSNFNNLMSNLKETNTDQQKIIGQLKNLKTQYQNKQSRLKIKEENQKEKQIIKSKQKQEKNKKIFEIKEEITKMKQGTDKDVLILKLNEKVQSLEEILKNAIKELHQEKQPKLIPKIINYYQNQPKSQSHRTQRSQQSNFNDVELSRSEQQNLENSQIGKLDEDYYFGNIKNALKELKQQNKEPQQYFIDQFSSPLQLDLTAQDYPLICSRNRSQQFEENFVPSPNSVQYHPNALDYNNKYLRRCLTQKSSILFESFEFYITGKYTITNNDHFPVSCEIRVANRCAINLYDVFVVVYGPQAQERDLQMRPPKIMHDQFRYGTSFLFEVDLSKICIDKGNFNIQISYKTDSINKKKVNFKAVIPFMQLIKPQFIYEEQFISAWNHMGNQLYTKPKLLDFKTIRSHEDLKLIMPLIEINQNDANSFSYGIMFGFPKSNTVFMMKVTCYVSGKASIHLKNSQSNQQIDKKLRQQTLDIISYLIYG